MTATLVVEAVALDGGTVEIVGDDYRHLFRARRTASGERVRLTDGRGRARWGRIVEVGRSAATVVVEESAPTGDPDVGVELLVAAPKPDRASWLVEKATELGVVAIRFLALERAPRTFTDRQATRLERVARAALQQSGGAWLPEISGPHGLESVLGGGGTAVVLAPAEVEWTEILRAMPGGVETVRVFVGPEGGWTDAELEAFGDAGIPRAGLGPRILRIETAAIVAAARALAELRKAP